MSVAQAESALALRARLLLCVNDGVAGLLKSVGISVRRSSAVSALEAVSGAGVGSVSFVALMRLYEPCFTAQNQYQ